MRIFVTGASGFVGTHIVTALRERGAEIPDERAELLDRAELEDAFAGCDAVVHAAARYSYDDEPARIHQVNVEGTRNVLEACARSGVGRLVYTSTAGTCGPVRGRPATEEDIPPLRELSVPYKRSKVEAERLVLEAARSELDALVVNPTVPVGEGDLRPTPTGRMIAGVAGGWIRGYIPTTGLNVVDVRDVGEGHALALEHGCAGERYLLGGVNLWLGELFAVVAALAGQSRPRIRVPYGLALAAATVGLANQNEVRLARLPMFFSSAKAERELGYAPGPVEPALARAVAELAPQPFSTRRDSRRPAKATAPPPTASRT
ncbi:MAG: NAD-dependent epimerase/dehydratase family protein [Gaiellaceae bacterium]